MAFLITQLDNDLLGGFEQPVVEPLRSDLKIGLAVRFFDRMSELFCLSEDRAENPELAAFCLVEGRFTPPAR